MSGKSTKWPTPMGFCYYYTFVNFTSWSTCRKIFSMKIYKIDNYIQDDEGNRKPYKGSK